MAEETIQNPQHQPGYHNNRWYKKRGLPIPDRNIVVPAPAKSGKAPTATPTSPWYQSTLLWGCLSLAAAIVLTVVAAMKKDVRWLLIFAWPFIAIAAWEFASYFTRSNKIRTVVVCVSAVISATGLYGLSVWLKPIGGENQLQAQFAPDRHLTINQADSMVMGLKLVPFINRVTIAAPHNNPEAWQYASELQNAFRQAKDSTHWDVGGIVDINPDDIGPGVSLLFIDSKKANVPTIMFEDAFSRADQPVPHNGVSPKAHEREVIVAVGRKG